jgi:hypothetical protein
VPDPAATGFSSFLRNVTTLRTRAATEANPIRAGACAGLFGAQTAGLGPVQIAHSRVAAEPRLD